MKRRLKLKSSGWFVHWITWLSGTKDIRTGITYPDEYGCFQRELWVGPFDTAQQALEKAEGFDG